MNEKPYKIEQNPNEISLKQIKRMGHTVEKYINNVDVQKLIVDNAEKIDDILKSLQEINTDEDKLLKVKEEMIKENFFTVLGLILSDISLNALIQDLHSSETPVSGNLVFFIIGATTAIRGIVEHSESQEKLYEIQESLYKALNAFKKKFNL